MTHRLKQLFSPAALAAVMAFTACSKPAPHTPADLASAALIPLPVSVTATGSSFALSDKTGIYVQGSNPEVTRIAEFLAGYLNPATGLGIAVNSAETLPASGHIGLMLKPDAALGTEGYELIITETAITLSAPEPAGLFMGIQTLRQLLPARVEAKSAQQGPWEIATGTIRDFPAYGYRGSMLDVGRHFFGVTDVKRYIDLMALYKFNVLHLGLTNDQGWRIEIKSWPRLATYGGSTEVGGGEGGYYTQEQYKDIVAYAAARQILIIPEIDMPGHTQAALASYPMLNCNGKKPELYTGTDVGFSTFCTSNDSVYIFIDDVIRELAALTPGAYIHIGGDESHATKIEDYIPFINKVKAIVEKHGKQMIGWDETAQAGLDGKSVVQLWNSEEFAKIATGKGSKLIMSPAKRAYIDMQYDSSSRIGLHWAAYIEVDDAYNWDPATYVPGISRENILGIEAALWTETVATTEDIDYLAFPRLPGYGEIGWTPTSQRNWESYQKRLAAHGARFKALGIGYYPSKKVNW